MITFKQFMLDEEDLGLETVMLKDGFYMEKSSYAWHIKRLMDDDKTVAMAVMMSNGMKKWAFRQITGENNAFIDFQDVTGEDLNNLMKFKWWVYNRLIKHGMVENAK
jgi:hypothetical protein